MSRISATVLAVLAAPSFASASTWEIDPSHSTAQFSVRHLMVSTVRGEFSKVSGTIELDDKDITRSSVVAEIDASTINTREPKRDAHLKSPDFFDVEKTPKITFKSKKVLKGSTKGHLKMLGDLTMHGVTKEVTLDVEGPTAPIKDPWGNVKAGAAATTKVNRQDFGLKWNAPLEAGGVVVSNDVNITIDVELTKKAPKEAAAK